MSVSRELGPNPTYDTDRAGGVPARNGATMFMISGEAALFLRLSKRTLERMRVEGTGPRYLKAGPGKRSRVLYRQTDLLTWLEARSFVSTSEYGKIS